MTNLIISNFITIILKLKIVNINIGIINKLDIIYYYFSLFIKNTYYIS